MHILILVIVWYLKVACLASVLFVLYRSVPVFMSWMEERRRRQLIEYTHRIKYQPPVGW